MYFYVQQVDIDKATRQHEVILDVESLEDHLQLASQLGGPFQRNESVEVNKSSMLRFSYFPAAYKDLKEGSWYDIDPKVFADAEYESVNLEAEGALLMRGVLRGIPDNVDFESFLIPPRIAELKLSTEELLVGPNLEGDIELTVVDCGHGNWNEISTTTDRVIYDIGACRRFTKVQIRALIAGRCIEKEVRPISVVISHWDVDHYHALLEFNPVELAKLRVVFMPSQVPDTETYRRVLKLLTDNKIILAMQQPAPRPGTSREITLERNWERGRFTMFRGTPGRSRNQTGIVLGVRGKNEVALLTGDHHYGKVLTAASKVSSYYKKPCVLVTPHHGGMAGNPSAIAWLSLFSSITTPVSCGANSYGHPTTTVQAELMAMQCGAVPWRTDVSGTWTKKL